MEKVFLFTAYFFFYSVVGWILECCWCSIGETRRARKIVLINRGFLAGPLCPIYGSSAVAMAAALQPFADNLVVVFFLGIVVCDTVEYLTSYFMEKIFNARWWDYSNRFLNLHGRICFLHSCMWGVMSVIFIHYINPFVTKYILGIPPTVLHIIIYASIALLLIDIVVAVTATIDINVLRKKLRSIHSESGGNKAEAAGGDLPAVVEIGSAGGNNIKERLAEFRERMDSIPWPRRMHIKHIMRQTPDLKRQVKIQLAEIKVKNANNSDEIKQDLKDLQEALRERFSSGPDSNNFMY